MELEYTTPRSRAALPTDSASQVPRFSVFVPPPPAPMSEKYLIKNEVPLCPGSNLDQLTKALGGLLN